MCPENVKLVFLQSFEQKLGEIMEINKKYLLVALLLVLLPLNVFSEEGNIAVLDVQTALLGTEASKQAF